MAAPLPTRRGGATDTPSRGGADTAARRFLAGALSASLTAVFTQPLELTKTLQQSHEGRGGLSALAAARGAMARGGGLAGLWVGLGPSLLRVSLGAGLYFASLSAALDALGPARAAAPGAAFCAAAAARCAALVALSPVSVVKVRMEAGTLPRGLSTLRAAAHVARSEGAASLFTGLVPTILRDAPYSGLYFSLYSALRRALRGEGGGGGGGGLRDAAATFAAGLVASSIATTVTHPADVLKTHQQLRAPGTRLTAELRRLLAVGGPRALFTGLPARLAKRGTSAALTWSMFEKLEELLLRGPEGGER